ncbi:MAG: DEAD/DEAH box helicase family protein, partial [Fimbriimonadales bacterium]|nr:DEAD/DEAH box helicase family protein [Fimbriimonadales bacterium]
AALRNARNILWKYYEAFVDYQRGEPLTTNEQRKALLWQCYRDNGVDARAMRLEVGNLNRRFLELLHERYDLKDGSYEPFINRMSFWMATGSGKTLVIVKLIEMLWTLIQRGEIPPHDILFLTHRDDLIEQLRRHIDEFNAARTEFRINLRDLREYDTVKRLRPSLFTDSEATVFCYRADNLSDEQKEKIVDFRNYENEGRWYVLLDEAHKGDRAESKRQHIYSMLSRNGFLFNFSATFTDPRDIATTVYNFNLSEYLAQGYGKRIVILQQELNAFRDKQDFTGAAKQKVVLKALLCLALMRYAYQQLPRPDAYHNPLLLTLVNSVSTEDSDLELFFRELRRIALGQIESSVWQAARKELYEELAARPKTVFGGDRLQLTPTLLNFLQQINPEQLRELVFHASAPSEVEVILHPQNRQELAFKLKNADRPFALIKIGDISAWLREKLQGYEVIEQYDDASLFRRLNEDDSDITILMGSRAFYEGWDSNRPNVLCYINIGTGEDARKFILQSVGRGVRIEPLRNQRRRLQWLYNAGIVNTQVYHTLQEWATPLETLLVFGTQRKALEKVIQELERERLASPEHALSGIERNPEVESCLLLIPVYRLVDAPVATQRVVAKLEVARDEFERLQRFVNTVDERVLLCLTDATVPQLRLLQRSMQKPEQYYRFNGSKRGDLLRLLKQVVAYFAVQPYEAERLKPLENEIRHFQQIRVALQDVSELQRTVDAVRKYPERVQEVRALYGKVSPEEYEARSRGVRREEAFSHDGQRIIIKHIARHYYLPVIMSETERADFIKHIIKTDSERKFLRDLEQYVAQSGNCLTPLDWWAFSKIDESLDEVFLWYYDPNGGRMARFKPDFIFWLQRGDRYWIVFVDPKGLAHTDWMHKVEGYRSLFEQGGRPREWRHNGLTVQVLLRLYTDDVSKAPSAYRRYCADTIKEIFSAAT